MDQQTVIYLAITVISVVFAVGTFVGINRMSFKTLENTLVNLQVQIQELRDEQKSINELNTRMALVEKGLINMEKCQDHIQTDLTILKKRPIKKIED